MYCIMPGGGLSREGDQPYQPSATFHTPACGGHNCGPQYGPCPLPLVQAILHVYTPGGYGGEAHWYNNVQEGGGAKSSPSSRHRHPGRSRDRVFGAGPGP